MYAWKKLVCQRFMIHLVSKVYKKTENPSIIGLILTNNPRSFLNSCVIETNLLDFHRIVVTVTKTSFERLKPRVLNYRDYKSFENKLFREEL